ncbi:MULTISPECIES: heavy metal translocating P-type ATPase [Exiguobacterium]|uniref:heavy metal translocating P-type ATPase n=1 Tax=Exiguobacterium TaxID=33986 RepID=UPI001BEB4D7A|nr:MULTISPECIES: heavy metal translocating P-type ATPase [Exiguobacterium]MCT4782416.1 heavy metal translocating P-type ATPase [Exiguobacterium himgiriensis]
MNTSTVPHEKSHVFKRASWLEHIELIMALVSGVLIVLAYLAEKQVGAPSVYVTLYLSAFLIGGYAKAKEGLTDTWETRSLNVELLMIIAAIGAASIGYWMEGAILIFIFALSGALETYTMNKNERALESLMELQPEQATRVTGDRLEVVQIEDLAVGDQIYVRPGERIPVDGRILSGNASIEEAAITGESIPVDRGIGDDVFGSSVNLNGVLTIEVTKLATETLFQKIIQMVQQAQEEKSPSAQFIDRYEGRYVQIVLASVTAIILLGPFLTSWSLETSIYRGMILLVVASPCALVAAITPAALAAIAASAKHGILFKGGAHIENMGRLKAIAFDKTGTLTIGKPEVQHVLLHPDVAQDDVYRIVSLIEEHSMHPLAEALVAYTGKHKGVMEEFKDVTGSGIEATIDGMTYRVGKQKFADRSGDFFTDQVNRLKSAGHTLVFISDASRTLGAFALRDTLRPEAKQAIERLNRLGIATIMITGDNESTARAIATEAGLTRYIAECLPEEKVAQVKLLKAEYGSIGMIGDGINDAPALATADVGIAMGEGTDAALETADVVLMKNDLVRLSSAIEQSRKLNRIVLQNVVFALGVILVLIATNIFELLVMPFAVVGHEGSTILVILNGLRLLSSSWD